VITLGGCLRYQEELMPALSETFPMSVAATPSKRLLVVEDECVVALTIADQLIEFGYTVIGPAFTISEARRLAGAASIDAALVDVGLNGVPADEIVDILSRRRIPFLFVTGYDPLPVSCDQNAAVLKKPFGPVDLAHAVDSLLAEGRPEPQFRS